MSNYITATTQVDATNKLLVFNTEGYYVVGDDQWQDITFTTELIYNGGSIGIAPRVYEPNMFLFLSIGNQQGDASEPAQGIASFNAQVTFDTYSIGQEIIAPLTVGATYTLRTDIRGTNYRISLNGAVLFNIEYPGMSRGRVGVYSTAGNQCKSIQVEQTLPDGWSNNASTVPGGYVAVRELENEDKYVRLFHPGGSAPTLIISQDTAVQGSRSHTASFLYKGAGTVRVTELTGLSKSVYSKTLPFAGDWVQESFTHAVSADATSARLQFRANNQTLDVNDVQWEPKELATGYIHNDSTVSSRIREHSVVTYPADENIDRKEGTLVMWFSPNRDYTMTTTSDLSKPAPTLFEYGTELPMRISYSVGSLSFNYGNAGISIPVDLYKGEWYSVIATWKAGLFQLYVNEQLAQFKDSLSLPDESPVIRIGSSADEDFGFFDGLIDETIVLSSVLTAAEIKEAAEAVEPLTTNSSMTMRATFNYAIGNFNKSIIEGTMTPNYGSPVLVEKRDGKPLRKVSFFDFYTGEYRTFNEEVVTYDALNDYVTISYHDKDVDQESFKLKIENAEGVQFGMPYELDGFKVRMQLTETEKNLLDGEYLYVSYQLEDSYTVDFNIGVPDSFRVTLGKHDGTPVKVTYEGNRFSDEKLATMVELNPMLNPNHEGFLYITRNDEQVAAFRGMATPSDLAANGSAQSLIVIEPLDTNGNYVSHCQLDVSCDYGTVVPAFDSESIKLRDRAGRFLYRYRAPILTIDQVGSLEAMESINVIDRETGIGIKIPMVLVTLQQQLHTLKAGDTLFSIADQYGTTRLDIASVNDKGLDQMAGYVLRNIGKSIRIPVNYDVQAMERTPATMEQDSMIGYLTNQIILFFNRPSSAAPQGLGALLDFNGDGMIDIREIHWLQGKRLTDTLTKKYNEVVAWHQANQ